MLRFGSDKPDKPRRVVPTHARAWHLVFMLVVTVALMTWLGYRAQHAENQEPPIRDLSGTSVVTAEPSQSESVRPNDDGDAVHMVELSRLREFEDHEKYPTAEPYYYLLDLARHNPAEWMEQHARRDVTWAHLLRDPDNYRGQLVLLRGQLLQLKRDELGDNDYGLTTRYEGWVSTQESGKYAYAVIVTDPPTGLSLGMPNEGVAVAGYFLGWWRHLDQNGKPTSSPLILGHRFVVLEQPQRPDAAISQSYGLAIGAGIVMLALVTVYFSLRRGRSPVAERLQRDAGPLVFEERPASSTTPDAMRGDSRLN